MRESETSCGTCGVILHIGDRLSGEPCPHCQGDTSGRTIPLAKAIPEQAPTEVF